jgi:putative ABC transport system substrate-binding protein
MRRREFVTGLGAAVALPALARAQQAGAVRRIGVLMAYAESDTESQSRITAFRNELAKLGWDEKQNLVLDIRWSTAISKQSGVTHKRWWRRSRI